MMLPAAAGPVAAEAPGYADFMLLPLTKKLPSSASSSLPPSVGLFWALAPNASTTATAAVSAPSPVVRTKVMHPSLLSAPAFSDRGGVTGNHTTNHRR